MRKLCIDEIGEIKIGAPPNSLIDSTTSPKVKIMEG
jgi:hypothetical protein